MKILVALLIFTLIVVAHEFGHFLFAKKNGIGVPEFSVGMGPRILTVAKTKKGVVVRFFCSQKKMDEKEDWKDVTRYSWKLLPLGGSCAMVGEDEENDAPNSFNSKGVWARFIVIFAGPLFNFILAFLLSLIILSCSGIDYPLVDAVYDNQPAQAAGIREGDLIKSVNGRHIIIGRQITTYLQLHPLTGEEVPIVIERDGKEQTIMLDPNYHAYLFGFSYSAGEENSTAIEAVTEGMPFDTAGIVEGDVIKSVNGTEVTNGAQLKEILDACNAIGNEVTFVIEHGDDTTEYTLVPESYDSLTLGFYAASDIKGDNTVFDVIKYSFVEVWYWIESTVASLGQLVTGKLRVSELSGVVGIVSTVGSVLDQSISYGMFAVVINMLYMAVLLSANLGVMNLLPIPALDGGRLVFIIIEAIRGKPVDRTKEGYIHFAGFVALMAFMVFVMYNDIIKIIR